jgi:putative peptidoglycan lipid II flippase
VIKNIIKGAKTIGFYTILSRIMGFFRDIVIAHFFGASLLTDIFFVSFRIPNTFRAFLGEGAMNAAVVPVLSDYEKDAEATGNLVVVFFFIFLALTAAGVLFPQIFAYIFAPGLLKHPLLIKLIRINFPYILLIGSAILFSGIMNTHKHFGIPAFSPVLLNVSLIACTYIFYNFFHIHIYALCVGVLLGGLLQMLFCMGGIFYLHIPIKLSFHIKPSTKKIFTLLLPALGSMAAIQLYSVFSTLIASLLEKGSISYIWYADRLFQLPFAVLSISLSQAALPYLTDMKKEEINTHLSRLFRLITFIIPPISVFLIIWGEDVVRIVFVRGAFTLSNAHNTYLALAMFMIGLLPYSYVKLFSSIFYSFKDTKTPMKVAVKTAIFSIAMAFLLGFTLGFWGLALAFSLGGIINAFLLSHQLKKKIGKFAGRKELGLICGSFALSFLCASFVSFFLSFLNLSFIPQFILEFFLFFSLVFIVIAILRWQRVHL